MPCCRSPEPVAVVNWGSESSLRASPPHSAWSDIKLELETGHGGICTIEIDKHYKSRLPLPGEPAVTHFFPAHHRSIASSAPPPVCVTFSCELLFLTDDSSQKSPSHVDLKSSSGNTGPDPAF